MAGAAELADAFIRGQQDEMAERLEKITHCFGQLSEEDVWWRPFESHNALGNVILHLCGNMRQWLIDGIAGTPDLRDRPAEFSHREPLPKAELIARLERTIGQADQILASLGSDDLLEPRRIQGFEVTVMAAILSSVPHLCGHTQEIIWITRLRRGESYQFSWTPQTREEGAPA